MPTVMNCPHCRKSWPIGNRCVEIHYYCPYCARGLLVDPHQLTRSRQRRSRGRVLISVIGGTGFICVVYVYTVLSLLYQTQSENERNPVPQLVRGSSRGPLADRPVASNMASPPARALPVGRPTSDAPVRIHPPETVGAQTTEEKAILSPTAPFDQSPSASLAALERVFQAAQSTPGNMKLTRRHEFTEEELRKQLADVLEVRGVILIERPQLNNPQLKPAMVAHLPELRGLPFR